MRELKVKGCPAREAGGAFRRKNGLFLCLVESCINYPWRLKAWGGNRFAALSGSSVCAALCWAADSDCMAQLGPESRGTMQPTEGKPGGQQLCFRSRVVLLSFMRQMVLIM